MITFAATLYPWYRMLRQARQYLRFHDVGRSLKGNANSDRNAVEFVALLLKYEPLSEDDAEMLSPIFGFFYSIMAFVAHSVRWG